jgi:hypothetical protein
MRRITRNAILVILACVALLLALGALPSLLKSGDPYYVVATTAEPPGETVNVSNLSERRYEYTTGAVAAAAGNGTGRSAPYWEGPLGFKEGFTHSPFDEFDALTRDHPNATETVGNDSRVYLADNGTAYRVVITQTPGAIGADAGTADTSARLTGFESVGAAAPRTEVAG